MTDVKAYKEGVAGRILLDRPKVLNSLNPGMINDMTLVLNEWKNDDSVTCVIIEGAGEKAFCAGGDIQLLCKSAKSDVGYARAFFRDEYKLNALIENYPKPYIAIMDGITMGGGVGVSSHGSHRIVSERTILAMPEVAIGFLPDVGGSWLLEKTPGKVGHYISLTAVKLKAADAIYAGFADYYVPSSEIPSLIEEIVGGVPVDSAIEKYSNDAPAGELPEKQNDIDKFFAFDTLSDIIANAEKATDDFSKETLKKILPHSPFSLACTFEVLKIVAAANTLEECLIQEYRFTHRHIVEHDFHEGVRAAVIDKDRNPKWDPPTLDLVSNSSVEQIFSPLDEEDLKFS